MAAFLTGMGHHGAGDVPAEGVVAKNVGLVCCGRGNVVAMIVGGNCREIRAVYATDRLVNKREGATGLIWSRLSWPVT